MTQTEEPANHSLLTQIRRKTVNGLLRTWQEIKGSALHAISEAPKDDEETLRRQMQLCLDNPGGEVSARVYTAELGRVYLGLNDQGRAKFLKLLAGEFDIEHTTISKLAKAYGEATKPADWFELEMKMRSALVTRRSTILKQFTALPDGFRFLVNMRADLLPLVGKDIALKGLEFDLKNILSAWFDVGLLDLAEITWNSPAALLEKMMEYEAVHRIASWDDLKNRLDSDRRVFAFFHNKMPLEPLIFVQVAFTQGMSDSIQQVLDEESPPLDAQMADTAIFYSISNAQKGLAGISFGNFLIKRVVAVLTAEMKNITTFATLSPVPGFRLWLDPLLVKGDDAQLLPKEQDVLKTLVPGSKPAAALLSLLNGDWSKDKKTAEALKPVLLRLCSYYLLHEKKDKMSKSSPPLDPVANFHLFNGARLERINWLGDTSPKGFKQSAGIMVNYHYKLPEIDDNHEEFVSNGKIVAGKQVKGYAE